MASYCSWGRTREPDTNKSSNPSTLVPSAYASSPSNKRRRTAANRHRRTVLSLCGSSRISVYRRGVRVEVVTPSDEPIATTYCRSDRMLSSNASAIRCARRSCSPRATLGLGVATDGSPLEAGGILNPASTRLPGGELLLYPRCVEEGNISRIGTVHAQRKRRPIRVRAAWFCTAAGSALRSAIASGIRLRRSARHLRCSAEVLRYGVYGIRAGRPAHRVGGFQDGAPGSVWGSYRLRDSRT